MRWLLIWKFILWIYWISFLGLNCEKTQKKNILDILDGLVSGYMLSQTATVSPFFSYPSFLRTGTWLRVILVGYIDRILNHHHSIFLIVRPTTIINNDS